MPYPGPSPWCVPTPHLVPLVWTVSHCSPRNLHLLSLPTEREGGKQTDLGVPTEWGQSHEQSKPSMPTSASTGTPKAASGGGYLISHLYVPSLPVSSSPDSPKASALRLLCSQEGGLAEAQSAIHSTLTPTGSGRVMTPPLQLRKLRHRGRGACRTSRG